MFLSFIFSPSYSQLFVVGFLIKQLFRALVEKCFSTTAVIEIRESITLSLIRRQLDSSRSERHIGSVWPDRK